MNLLRADRDSATSDRSPDDLFGGPPDSPRTDAMIAAAVQLAERIRKNIDGDGVYAK